MIDRLTTGCVPQHQRVDYWQTICSQRIGTFELRDYEPDNFHSQLGLFNLGELTIGRFEGVRQTLERKKNHIKSADVDHYIVLLESENTFTIEHCGRQRSGSGGIVLVDVTRPYFTNHPEGLDVVDIFIPRRKLEAAFGSAPEAAGLCIETTQATFPVLSTFLRSLTDPEASFDRASAARVSSIAVDLIAAAFSEKMSQTTSHQLGAASTLFQARYFIECNLGKFGLGMQEVAAAVNTSVRQLCNMALEEGISLVDWMWHRRLIRAQAMLTDPAHGSLSIRCIANACGFLDQAHFSRRFKGAFGLTPTECRQMAHAASSADDAVGQRTI